ncbi:MAG: aminotransferase class V-fold PLP-dependent enzyme [Pirellulaceae bacterium]|nr:aminotransferase class V-fold PLP-dependent enzyme [Pirellulaceae bacterium]
MSPRACRASIDFARLASEHGSTLYSDDFFRFGSGSLPDASRERYPSLSDWQGPQQFSRQLSQLMGVPSQHPILFASRSASLMKCAARLLFRRCRNVLITDLTWPAYERILRREQRRTGNRIHKVAVRREILQGRLAPSELIERLAEQFASLQCDGLFLPLVDNLGLHLPAPDIAFRIRRQSEMRFCVIDGAQAFRHVPLELDRDYCDFMVAGCHKWLCAHNPMGLGILGRNSSRDFITASLTRWLKNGTVDDPLMVYSQELITGEHFPFGETAPILPLLTANAATVDASESASEDSPEQSRRDVIDCVRQAGWTVVSPESDYASRILLIRPAHVHRGPATASHQLRRLLLEHQIAATTYDGSLVRLALPSSFLQSGALDHLRDALSRISQKSSKAQITQNR